MTQPNLPDRKVKPAHELVAGDVIADDLFDEPTPVLGVHEFEECGQAAILTVVRDAQGCAFAREFDYDAPVPVLAAELTGFRATAAELRRIADAIQDLPSCQDQPYVSMTFIPNGSKASPEQRIAGVDALALGVLGKPGDTVENSPGDWYHLVRGGRAGMYIAVQESIPSPHETELERLRARVAELEAAKVRLDEQATGDLTGLTYSREVESVVPVSPARGDGPVHIGAVVDGGALVDETPPGSHAEHWPGTPLVHMAYASGAAVCGDTSSDRRALLWRHVTCKACVAGVAAEGGEPVGAAPSHFLEPGAGDGDLTDVLACGLTVATSGDGGYVTSERAVTCRACRASALLDETPPCYVANGFQAPEVIAEREAWCAASHPGRECTRPVPVSESR